MYLFTIIILFTILPLSIFNGLYLSFHHMYIFTLIILFTILPGLYFTLFYKTRFDCIIQPKGCQS